jgi:hypothetical protein
MGAHWQEFSSAEMRDKGKLPAADIGRTIKLSFAKGIDLTIISRKLPTETATAYG